VQSLEQNRLAGHEQRRIQAEAENLGGESTDWAVDTKKSAALRRHAGGQDTSGSRKSQRKNWSRAPEINSGRQNLRYRAKIEIKTGENNGTLFKI
jgi:hypothetical protein